MRSFFQCLFLFVGLSVWSSQTVGQVPTPAPAQDHSILIYNATAHIGTGRVIETAAIAMDSGRIVRVYDLLVEAIDTNDFKEVIDATGKHVYPGFILTNNVLGLTEIGAVRASHDFQETGKYNPFLRTLTSYNTDSKIIPTVRSNGILITQVTPRGGVLSGTSSVVHLDAWNWEDAVVRADDGVHLNWPRQLRPHASTKKESHTKETEALDKFFREAQAYAKAKAPVYPDARLEALRGVFEGTQTLYIHANKAKEILKALQFARNFELKKIVLVGGHDAWLLTDQLKDQNVPVILRRVHSLPMRRDEPTDLPFQLPALLYEAGVEFALAYEGDMEAMGSRNLPFLAGTTVAYGLPKEEAIKSITLSPAKILGIADRVGSLEAGKDATLFISEGDALDMQSNAVVRAFIQGRSIDLNNHQQELYEKFKGKYGQE